MENEFGRSGFPERPFSSESNRRPLKMANLIATLKQTESRETSVQLDCVQ